MPQRFAIYFWCFVSPLEGEILISAKSCGYWCIPQPSGSKPTFQQERALCKLWYTPCRAPQDRQKTASLLPSSATRSVFTQPRCEATAAADTAWRVQRTLLLASSSLVLGTLHPRQTRPRTSWLLIQRPGWTKSRRHSTNSYSERILVFC